MNEHVKIEASNEIAIGIKGMNKWFGSFHDGSEESDEAMKARALSFHSK